MTDTAAPEVDGSAADPAAPIEDENHGPAEPRRSARGCVLEIVQTVALTIGIFLVIQWFIAQPFQVQQFSMERTFLSGDYVLVDRLSRVWHPYEQGEVIVFQPPPSWADAGKPFIKRVIGVAGDTVELRDGAVLVNGVVLDEPYLYRNASGDVEPTDATDLTTWLVPAGQLFVMGDHRRRSADSRVFGPIEVSSVVGRAFVRYWPLDRFGLITRATYDGSQAP